MELQHDANCALPSVASLGFSRQWSAQLINRRGFPEPIAVLAIGSVWLADDVEQWITDNRPALEEPSDPA
jgi:predicted DNA-binding transcriptional regulator AlpA